MRKTLSNFPPSLFPSIDSGQALARKGEKIVSEGHPHTPGPSSGSGQAPGLRPSAHPMIHQPDRPDCPMVRMLARGIEAAPRPLKRDSNLTRTHRPGRSTSVYGMKTVSTWTLVSILALLVLAQIHRRDDYAAAERAIGAREGDGPGTIWGRGGPVSVFSCRGETL